MMARITGHDLMCDGAPYDDTGHLTALRLWKPDNQGRGRCECGAMSDWLPSDTARKDWHWGHREAVGWS
jgi:hypothetical protein